MTWRLSVNAKSAPGRCSAHYRSQKRCGHRTHEKVERFVGPYRPQGRLRAVNDLHQRGFREVANFFGSQLQVEDSAKSSEFLQPSLGLVVRMAAFGELDVRLAGLLQVVFQAVHRGAQRDDPI